MPEVRRIWQGARAWRGSRQGGAEDWIHGRSELGVAAPPGWADSAVIIPCTLYLAYGDRRVVEADSSMATWAGYMRTRADDDLVWRTPLGDWLACAAADPEARSYPGATTARDLIAAASFADSTDLVGRPARVLRKRLSRL